MHRRCAVPKDLHLDMARFLDVFFNQYRRVAEGCGGLALRRGQRIVEILGVLDQPHALATAARDRFDQDRIADALGLFGEEACVLSVAVIAGNNGHARLFHQRLGRVLETHLADRTGRGADEGETGCLDLFHEIGVFRQKPIARMYALRAGGFGGGEDLVLQQVAIRRGRSMTDMDSLIRKSHMFGVSVSIGVDGDGAYTQTTGGFHHPACNFATVGNQDLVEHLAVLLLRDRRGRGRCPRTPGIFEVRRGYMRNTPKRVSSMGALRAALSDSDSTSRLLRGSIMPSSQSRAEA